MSGVKDKQAVRAALDEFLDGMRKWRYINESPPSREDMIEQDYIFADTEAALDKAYGVTDGK